MRASVLCVVIKIVIASSNIDQSQYSNDENNIRRFPFSRYFPLIPQTRPYYQNRLYNGLNIGTLYPQSNNAFMYNSRPIVPYLMNKVSNVYTNEERIRKPYIFGRNINRFVITKTPSMDINSKRMLDLLLLKELIYKVQNGNVHINGIRDLIINLLQGKGNDNFINTNIKQEIDLIKFITQKIKEWGSYQELQQNSTGLPSNEKSNELKNEEKNNQNNSKIDKENLPVNVGGNVSNNGSKSIIKSNEDKAISNETMTTSSSQINNSTNNSKEIDNKGNLPIGENNGLNKNKDIQRTKSLSSQSHNSTFTTKNHRIMNVIEKYNNQRALDYVLPNDRYYADSKKYFLINNYQKKLPEQENIINYNIRKNLGYHNLHQVSQEKSDFEKTDDNDKNTNRKQALKNIGKKMQNKLYQIEKFKRVENHTRHLENSLKTDNHDIRDIVTENPLSSHISTIDQNKIRQYGVPLEFETEDLNESGIPLNSQEISGPRKSNNKDNESSSMVMVKWNLDSGKGSDRKDCHTNKDREDKQSMEVKNLNENDLHKITNLQDTQANLLIDSMKPIEITKTHIKTIKETKTITFADQSKLDSTNYFTHNNNKPNLWPPPVKKVIVTDHETADQIKINNNNGKSNLIYVILNNLSLSNDKNCKNKNSNKKGLVNKHITFFKSVKQQSNLSRGKEPTLVFEKHYGQYKDAKRYETKKKHCRDCKQNDNTQTFQNLDSLQKKVHVQSRVHSTTFNENMKMEGKNIQKNKNQTWNQTTGETSYRNKKYRQDKALTGYKDIKKESIHFIKERAAIEEQDNTMEISKVMTNKDKVIANILAPEDVKSDKKSLPYWLPSDAQEVYEILQQPAKDGVENDSLDLEMPLKEEIDKIIQLKKELGNENLEEIITLKVNTVGIGKATNIIDKLIPSLYDVYLKNFITKILQRLRQKLSNYEFLQQENKIKNLDIHEIRKVNSVIGIFESVRAVFNKQDDESLYDLLVSLLRFNKQSDEDFDEEVQVILDSVSRNSIYGVLRYFLVPEPTLDAVREYLKQQELYPQFVYYKVLEDILPNIRIIIINALAIHDKQDDIQKNEESIEKLVKILIILYKVMKDLGIPETTQRYIIEESVLDIVRNLANAYIKNYEEIVYVQIKKQLQDSLYNNINV